eukprot:PITA_29387
MLYDQDLPRFLWAEACNTTVYIQNRTPHRVLGKGTPKGVFTGKKSEGNNPSRPLSPRKQPHLEDSTPKIEETPLTSFCAYLSFWKRGETTPSSPQVPEARGSEETRSPGGGHDPVEHCILDEKRSKLDQTAEKGYLIPQALVAQVEEPSSFQEAVQHQVWVDAIVEEYSSVMTNDVWEVVLRPKDKSIVGSRCIYKIKYVADGIIKKYKARFVAKGYAQKEGIDYEEIFTLVA